MSPSDAIRTHNDAWQARDPARLVAMFAAGGLYEMPLLRSRMVGRAEIAEGLERGFAACRGVATEIGRLREAGATAMAEGAMEATLAATGERARIPFAMVAVVEGDAVRRFSVYLDARPFRLWSDGPVIALDRETRT